MSPLENHHCAVSFKILSSPECNIFANMSEDEFKEVRGVSVALCSARHDDPPSIPTSVCRI